MKTLNIILGLSLFSSVAFAQTEASGKTTISKSGAASSSYAATGKVIAPSTSKQTQGKTFGESMAGGLAVNQPGSSNPASLTNNPLYQGDSPAQVNPLHTSDANKPKPGNPIGGIIVKGGHKEH